MAITILKEPTNPCFSKNIIAYQVNTSLGLPVKARVYFESSPYSDTYDLLTELKNYPDADGNCIFYLHDLLEIDVLKYDKPDFSSVRTFMPLSCRRFKVDFFEYDSSANQLHDQVKCSSGSCSFVPIIPMVTGNDYLLKADNDQNIALSIDGLGSTLANFLYELNGEYWYSINAGYDFNLINTVLGSISIYEGTPPETTTSSVRFAILAGMDINRFALIAENGLLWGDEDYDLVINSEGEFIGVS